MIVITLQQFFILLWIFCIVKVILHGFRINIIGISMDKYFYKYNDIRSAILNFKKRILTQKKYPLKYKVKTLALWLCPGFYNFMIRGIRKARDKKAD